MFSSVSRGLPRIMVLLVMGLLFFAFARYEPLILGPVMAPVFLSLGVTLFALAISDLSLRILQPRVDAQSAAVEALRDENTAAGLVYLGRCILAAIMMLIIVSASRV